MTHVAFTPSARYPEPNVFILDRSFAKYRIYSSTIEQLGTGMRWAEGPVYFPAEQAGAPGYVLVSDIPNNRIMKFDEADHSFRVFSAPAHAPVLAPAPASYAYSYSYANGNTRDKQGRLITCEHSVTRRVVRTEKDGRVTVLADRYQNKRLNAPNDVVVKSDGSVWFTDPLFGINGHWEGEKESPEQLTTNVYCWQPAVTPDGAEVFSEYETHDGLRKARGELTAVLTDLVNPNGLAFSPDEKFLYVVECGRPPFRSIWRYPVIHDEHGFARALDISQKVQLIQATDYGALDGFRVDEDGNLWCGWGASSVLQDAPVDIGGGMQAYLPAGSSEALDGVKVFNPDGKAIGFIRLPERCANLTFGGPKRNRLYMASCHSLYALYVEARGAV